jgi:4-alpha-glucanotransferase
MLIQFTVKYHTIPGQSIHILGNHLKLGENIESESYPMLYLDNDHWRIQLDIDFKKKIALEYQYLIKDTNTGLTMYEQRVRAINLPADTEILMLEDTWSSPATIDYAFATSMFKNIQPDRKIDKVKAGDYTHRIEVFAPVLKENENLHILGNCNDLGNWLPQSAVRMLHVGADRFAVQLDLRDVHHPIEYKYIIKSKSDQANYRFENGSNRYVSPVFNPDTKIFKNDETLSRDTKEFWRGAGVAIPVFSLRTKNSLGVGEFPDLKLFGEWAKSAGMSLIQILPVNDTIANNNKLDTYPYAAISVFALHPQYLKISDLPYKMDKKFIGKLDKASVELNKSQGVDYENMMSTKWELIREIFAVYKNAFFAEEDFKIFFEENKHWLLPYSVFCVQRDINASPDFSQWKMLNIYDKKLAENFAEDNEAVLLHYFVQYHLHIQLSDAVRYLHELGIALKGDIPIGIYRYSCDAWMSPELYNMNMQAGAPPDSFAIKGQNWGFPTYNWDKMAEDGFKWWKDRFRQMSDYFDAFRIDHILGFFRIWQIPMESIEGIMGFFMPAIPIYKNELTDRGIYFDYHRFCSPYINDEILWNIFGENMNSIKDEFLEYRYDRFFFKPEFDTQKKISDHFETFGGEEYIKLGLFDLLSNFILIEVEGSNGTQFHPRYGFGDTYSFRHLDGYTKNQLYSIYDNYFYVRQDNFWEEKGLQKLPALKRSTDMLICGEDLGMVPACVPKVMNELGILSLEVQRMPKNPKNLFFHPADANYMSVISPSSHDTSTLRGWWEEDREIRQKFYNDILSKWGEAPEKLTSEILKDIIEQHFYSKAMLAIFPIQDYLGISEKLRFNDVNAERINIPAIFPHYWNYRLHIYIEDLIKEDVFNEELLATVRNAGR